MACHRKLTSAVIKLWAQDVENGNFTLEAISDNTQQQSLLGQDDEKEPSGSALPQTRLPAANPNKRNQSTAEHTDNQPISQGRRKLLKLAQGGMNKGSHKSKKTRNSDSNSDSDSNETSSTEKGSSTSEEEQSPSEKGSLSDDDESSSD
ncbi:uncharacterized protein MELLADRAFT_76752 [Melampsora larici-populina 98AG31]|uniref:Uncharacterized protein n=1 Tax=Melampsora larici-populina (strain 98AG31 / pathotype 3-4-7) TaxID=747676 RepID=F4R973_MELLP|nr:uncharacterized protein MELLADRAFT_76752 [Melampsora larici-populina 98AG31]EGG11202.1 hypothetical protein MELLADRAFT_76752 [Melampsora larici-populina 98AG31]